VSGHRAAPAANLPDSGAADSQKTAPRALKQDPEKRNKLAERPTRCKTPSRSGNSTALPSAVA